MFYLSSYNDEGWGFLFVGLFCDLSFCQDLIFWDLGPLVCLNMTE